MRENKILIIVCIIITLIVAIISLDCGALAHRVITGTADFVIVIDPGHGGMDGGASSSDGTLEKDINLAIADKLAIAAEEYNCTVVLTRETDEWLCETETGSIRSRKTADLIARQDIIRKYSPDIMVSIHLNSFKEDPKVCGAQVFYPSVNGKSETLQQCRKLADSIQRNLNDTLQEDSPRNAMIRDGVFLFKEVQGPMVIVECGFMSNPEDAAKLKTEDGQQQVAQCIMAGIAEFSGLEQPENVEIIDSLE